MRGHGAAGRLRALGAAAVLSAAVLSAAVLGAAGARERGAAAGARAPVAGGPPPNGTIAPRTAASTTDPARDGADPRGAAADPDAAAAEVLFVAERDGRRGVHAVNPATGAERRVVAAAGRDAFPAAVSPDGRLLAVVWSAPAPAGGAIETIELRPLDDSAPPLQRDTGRVVAPASGRARNPSWAPDGAWLAFESDRDGFREIYRVGRDGRGVRRLTRNAEGNFEPAVSPDGRTIVFASSRDGRSQIYRMRADGADERRLTAFHRDDWAPRWAPDGRLVAFLSDREGAARVFVMRPDGTGQRRLAPPAPASAAAVQEDDVAWAPDARRIAFTRRVGGGPPRVAVADVASGSWRELPCPAHGCTAPAWSPDGHALALVGAQREGTDLYLVPADGRGTARRLTDALGAEWLPRWRRVAAGR